MTAHAGLAQTRVAIKCDQGVAGRASAPLRIVELDLTKGALVLLMLLYHWLLYFFAQEGHFYRYLRFVTPSFIFITGFFVSNLYLTKYGVTNPKLPRRLANRGLKILALFISLNIAISLLIRDSYSGQILFSPHNVLRVFLTGNIVIEGGKAAAFYILVPISYVLLFSAALVPLCRLSKYVFSIAGLLLIICVLISHLVDSRSANLELTTIGVLGAICGQLSIERIRNFAAHSPSILIAYGFYLVAVTFWNVTFPLLVVGVFLSVLLLFAAATAFGASGVVQQKIALVGQYSLFAYVAQIAILQILYRLLRTAGPIAEVRWFSVGAAFILMILSVVVLEHARAASITVNRLYRAVFS